MKKSFVTCATLAAAMAGFGVQAGLAAEQANLAELDAATRKQVASHQVAVLDVASKFGGLIDGLDFAPGEDVHIRCKQVAGVTLGMMGALVDQKAQPGSPEWIAYADVVKRLLVKLDAAIDVNDKDEAF